MNKNLIDPDMFETGNYKEDHWYDPPTWKEIAFTVALVGLGVAGVMTVI